MKQLALTLAPPPEPSLGNFYPGRNVELMAALRGLADGISAERFFYLWGEPGSGRSHLLRAMAGALSARNVATVYAGEGSALSPVDAVPRALVVDDVDKLQPSGLAAFFNLYNSVREKQGIVIAAGSQPPAKLAMRPDLVTRLGWGLVYQVHALGDDEKIAALKRHASARAFDLPDGVAEYLLRHLRRDLPSLMTMLDALDQHSLETKRPITLPLLRELLQADAPDDGKMPPQAGP
jgi:DnaA-homolog protein